MSGAPSLLQRLEAADCALCKEAAEYIRAMRRQHNEELREEQRAQRDAYQEGRWAEREEQQQW